MLSVKWLYKRLKTKFYRLFLPLLIISNLSKADVIFAPASIPGASNRFALSLEGIVSYEMAFTKLNSIDF